MDFAEVKMDVNGLAVGMYVSRLDRPWLETPLPFQGFKILSVDDIQQVQRYCDYVYVDVEKGQAPRQEHRIDAPDPVPNQPKGNPYKELRKIIYEKSTQLEEELPKATDVYDGFSRTIKAIMRDIREDRLLDMNTVNKGVKDLLDSVVRNPNAILWVNRLRASDNYTYNHLITTSIWCAVMGRQLGLEREVLEELTLGGLLIDIGKAKLPTALLNKQECLTQQEFDLVKRHVDFGVRILAKTHNIPSNVMRIVATHHERWNGKGYPQGLKRYDIPVFGRIVGLIDSFAAMTAPRPFSTGVSPHEAIEEFYRNRGTFFEADLVEEFIQACGIYPTGSMVELNTGEVAIVIGLEGSMRLRPQIMLVLDENKQPHPNHRVINLSEGHKDLAIRKGLSPGEYEVNIEEIALM